MRRPEPIHNVPGIIIPRDVIYGGTHPQFPRDYRSRARALSIIPRDIIDEVPITDP